MTANLEETAAFSSHSTHLLTVCFSAAPPTPKNGKPGGACLSGRLKCSRDREEEEREQRQQQRRPRSREQTELHGRRLVSTHTIVGREGVPGGKFSAMRVCRCWLKTEEWQRTAELCVNVIIRPRLREFRPLAFPMEVFLPFK